MRPSGSYRVAVTFAAAVGCALALAACASGAAPAPGAAGQGTASGKAPTVVVSASVMQLPVAPASVSSAPAPVSPPAGAVPPCHSSQVAISLTRTVAELGTVGGFLTFTNRGTAPCTLTGWPAVTAITATGKRTAVDHIDGTLLGGWTYNPPAPVVTVAPGQSAYAALTDSDVVVGTAASCPPPYTRLQVAIPGGTPATISAWLPYADAYLPGCLDIKGSPDVAVSGIGPASALPH